MTSFAVQPLRVSGKGSIGLQVHLHVIRISACCFAAETSLACMISTAVVCVGTVWQCALQHLQTSAVGPQWLRMIRSVNCQGHAMCWCVTLLQHPPMNAQLCSKNSTTHTSQHTQVVGRRVTHAMALFLEQSCVSLLCDRCPPHLNAQVMF